MKPLRRLLLAALLPLILAAGPAAPSTSDAGSCAAWLHAGQDGQELFNSLVSLETLEDETGGKVSGGLRLTNEHPFVALRLDVAATLNASLNQACGPAVPASACQCVVDSREVSLRPSESVSLRCAFVPVPRSGDATTAIDPHGDPPERVSVSIIGVRCGSATTWESPSGYGLHDLRADFFERARIVTRYRL